MLRSSGILLTFIPMLLGAGPPVVKSAVPAPDLDALFQRTDGWIGGDGVYSVALSPKKTLWLFSDTWVGKVRDGRRTEATIVNNSVGIQAAGERVSFTVARGSDGKPRALIVPTDGRGWFWLQAGAADHGRLFLFLNQVEKTGAKGVFGFRSVGMWLGMVSNPEDVPESWHIEQVKMPNVVFTSDRTLTWGAAILRENDELYVYGTDERRGHGPPHRQMVLARCSASAISDFTQWRYFHDGNWDDDFRNATALADDIATEFSVTRLGQRYLAVTTERGLSPRIMGRLADDPWGPWSPPAVLYECPEMSRDKKLFSYAAKAHPSLSSGTEVVISYVVNSFDFWQVAREAELYWPRFVRVRIRND